MGLDITAYSNARLVDRHVDFPREWCEDEDHCQVFAYDSFGHSYRGLADADRFTTLGGEGFIGGRCYDISDSRTHSFRAGSYSGYSWWRERLAGTFNPHRDADLPFYELIWFADNEGDIGPLAAADLLGDFHAGYEAWQAECEGDTYDFHREVYNDWTKACELASDSGFIDFH
ncbi:MAG TPA: hypothetical protein VFC00_06980 [Micromonosporaceae bacterium]|nr:hypothetical protein [Micromonosporaceae bacterium]